MIEGVLIFIGGMVFGVVIGASLAWDRFCRTERPVIEISRQESANLPGKAVAIWLDERGLMWMPKGPDFKANTKQGDGHE